MDINIELADKLGNRFPFKKTSELIAFLEAESAFWKKSIQNIPNINSQYFGVTQQFDHAISKIKEIEKFIDESSEDTRSNLLQDQNKITTNLINQCRDNWIYRGDPAAHSLIQAYRISQRIGDHFINIIINHKNGNTRENDEFIAKAIAYELIMQDKSEILKRRSSEKQSLQELRNNLQLQITKTISDKEVLFENIESWKSTSESEYEKWLSSIKKTTDDFIKETKDASEESISNHIKFFGEMATAAVSKIKDLEDLYREKLRLEAPAQYWAKRAQSLGKQGGLFAVLLFTVSAIISVGAGTFFYSWINKQPVPFQLSSIQGIALFGATAAAATYIVRLLSRLTFSAFHLQRDAEEREQLCHLYLALINSNAIDTDSRSIVLQALFSRAESGLLNNDNGPTMPSPSELIASASRSRQSNP